MQGEIDPDAVLELFKLLEFPSLVPRLAEAFPTLFGDAVPPPDGPGRWSRPRSPLPRRPTEAVAALEDLAAAETIAVEGAWDGDPGRSPLLGRRARDRRGVGRGASTCPRPCPAPSPEARRRSDVRSTQSSYGAPRIAGHDAKPLIRSLLDRGLDLTGLTVDTKLAAYLLDPAGTLYSLDDLLRRHAGAELAGGSTVPEGQLDLSGDSIEPHQHAGRRALGVSLDRAARSPTSLEANGLTRLNDEVEVPARPGAGPDGAPGRRRRRRGADAS